VFKNARGRVLYVGRAQNLVERAADIVALPDPAALYPL